MFSISFFDRNALYKPQSSNSFWRIILYTDKGVTRKVPPQHSLESTSLEVLIVGNESGRTGTRWSSQQEKKLPRQRKLKKSFRSVWKRPGRLKEMVIFSQSGIYCLVSMVLASYLQMRHSWHYLNSIWERQMNLKSMSTIYYTQ